MAIVEVAFLMFRDCAYLFDQSVKRAAQDQWTKCDRLLVSKRFNDRGFMKIVMERVLHLILQYDLTSEYFVMI